MKCKLIKPLNVCVKTAPPELMAKCATRKAGGKTIHYLPAGTELDYPRAFILVRHGAAVAMDDESHKAARKSPEELAAAQQSFARLRAMIAPDDFHLFDAGYIAGYEMDGSYKPGPRWAEYQAMKEREQQATEGDEW